MRKLHIFLLLIFFLVISTTSSYAMFNPLSVSNNRFGIHVIDEGDLSDAAKLVNSSGGEYGYATFVIAENDRNKEKWQSIFNRLRRQKLIPIVRLATHVEHGVWVKPNPTEMGNWVEFLDSLNWVVENRYVIIFNEPNHAKEWGGEINPEEYAQMLKEFSKRLKEKSPDFFVLPAGLDASAPDSVETMSESTFLNRMIAKESDVFTFVDGWTSHSYPNPGFVGSPDASGRGTVRTFLWELSQYGGYIGRLPVFITETGWQHSQGKGILPSLPSPETVAQYYERAFQTAWSHPQIVAVTPFLLNYQDFPFDHFSFKKMNSSEYHPMFESIKKLSKVKGQPIIKKSAKLIVDEFPQKLVTNSDYTIPVDIENTGQAIIDGQDGWSFKIEGLPGNFETLVTNIREADPFFRTRVEVRIKTPQSGGEFPFKLTLYKDQNVVTQEDRKLVIVPPPGVLISAKLWIHKAASGTDFSFLVYDKEEKILHEVKNIEFKDGFATVENLYNIVPNERYRLVLTKPYYLPQQVHATLTDTKTAVSFPKMVPLDPSNDGSLNFGDVPAFFKRPLETIGLLVAL